MEGNVFARRKGEGLPLNMDLELVRSGSPVLVIRVTKFPATGGFEKLGLRATFFIWVYDTTWAQVPLMSFP